MNTNPGSVAVADNLNQFSACPSRAAYRRVSVPARVPHADRHVQPPRQSLLFQARALSQDQVLVQGQVLVLVGNSGRVARMVGLRLAVWRIFVLRRGFRTRIRRGIRPAVGCGSV